MDTEKINTVPSEMVRCPMLCKNIPDSFCYEINLVVDKNAVESFVPEIKDWDKAKKICPGCSVSFYKN